MLTTDERNDLHEQAAQLVYLAAQYDHLTREPLCRDDEFAERGAKKVTELIRGLLDDEWARIETVKEAEKVAKEVMVYE